MMTANCSGRTVGDPASKGRLQVPWPLAPESSSILGVKSDPPATNRLLRQILLDRALVEPQCLFLTWIEDGLESVFVEERP